MDYVFDYRCIDGSRDDAQLLAFIEHVKDHGFGVLQLFNDKTVKTLESGLDKALFEHSGVVYSDIVGGDDELRNASLKLMGGIRKSSVTSQIFYAKPILDVHVSPTMKYIFDSVLDRIGFRLPS